MTKKNTFPVLSVCVITYGHEKYLKQTLESIIQQKVNFNVELIISNDASPDNSDKIINDFIDVNSNSSVKIRYFKHDKNIGAIPNFKFALEKCNGKYIAICEGDDYWLNINKLQMQVDFLEANKDYSCCFHDVKVIYSDREVSFQKDRGNNISNPVQLRNLLESEWLVPTCSFVFKRENMVLPSFFDKLRFGDFILFCAVIVNSKAHYIDEELGAYRRNNFSSMTNETVFLGKINLKTDYIQFLNWLSISASEIDKIYINARIDIEIKEIRNQIIIYRNSKFMKLYMKIRSIMARN